jgi:hypothetical protein
MLRLIITICIFLFSALAQSEPQSSYYQIDLIVFMNQTQADQNQESCTVPLINHDNLPAITLIPSSYSKLANDYWALTKKHEYNVLAHYSWLQTKTNHSAFAFPSITHNGWHLTGTVGIRKSNYYLLDINLLFASEINENHRFVFNQKQKLKPDLVYHLDHSRAGILIKIHQIN